MIKKWEEKEGNHICSGALFNYSTKIRISPDGKKEGQFDILECSPWINIFALNRANEVILVEQYRHGIDDVTLEIPGGGVNRGESFLEGAKRELLEETGYSSSDWVKLGELQANPAFMTNTCTTFLALNCEKTQNQNLDPMEEIEVKLLPLKGLEKKIKMGEVAHSLVVSAYALYTLWKQDN
jgi:8-oxo-dGTP pyrophosphatase MutT (NUDIX family)